MGNTVSEMLFNDRTEDSLVEVILLHSELAKHDQKIVLSTNIAESSVTPEGVCVVVDSGLCRLKMVDPWSQIEDLVLHVISRSSADQRKGRVGRERNGVCVRLYPLNTLKKALPFQTPEVLLGGRYSAAINNSGAECAKLPLSRPSGKRPPRSSSSSFTSS